MAKGWPISERAADMAKPAVPLDPKKAEQNDLTQTMDRLRKAVRK